MFNALISCNAFGIYPASGGWPGGNILDYDGFYASTDEATFQANSSDGTILQPWWYIHNAADPYFHGFVGATDMDANYRIAYGVRAPWASISMDHARGFRSSTNTTRLPLGTTAEAYTMGIGTTELQYLVFSWSRSEYANVWDMATAGRYSVDGEPYFMSWAYIKPYELVNEQATYTFLNGIPYSPFDPNW